MALNDSVRVPKAAGSSRKDRIENDDPDYGFKPILRGVFSTRTDYDATKAEEADEDD